jgi:carboxyl-terminal processing protease
MQRRLRLLITPILVLLVLFVGIDAGVVFDRSVLIAHAQAASATVTPAPNFQVMEQAWALIQQYYVDRSALQSVPLTYGAISGMVNALGDTGHSTFLSPQMLKQENNYLQGQFEGIGAEVRTKNGHVVIVAPMDNSPAQKAGLRPGDIILKVNGQSIEGLTLSQVIAKIIGSVGTPVTLTLADPKTGATRDVTIVRAEIALHNVTWARLPGTNIADVRIAGFSQGVTGELQTALTDIKRQGMTSIVLDLRNDPGGELDQAIGAASQFLKSGDVLLEKNSQGQITHVAVRSGGLATNMPMMVLVNRGTASAAEIVAGALQDQQRATIVGETTFGTGTVLNQFPLSDGSVLLLATQEWLTPDGHSIWHTGITPNVVVSLPSTVEIVTPDAVRGMTSVQFQASGDAQLLRAIGLLSK